MINKSNIMLAAKKSLSSILKRVLLILSAFIIASIFLAVSGFEWYGAFKGLYIGVSQNISGTVKAMIPIMISALAVCIPMKAGIFNLGADGCIWLAGLTSTFMALSMPNLSAAIGIPMIFAVGAVTGMLYALIPALLKVYCNADEVVSTLLLNFIAEYITRAAILGPLKSTMSNSTEYIGESYWLAGFMGKANVGVFIGLAVAVIVFFIMYKTKFGYEVKIVGSNPKFARYGGIVPAKTIFLTMMISGAIAGIAGTVQLTGVHHRLIGDFNAAGVGFDGITVAILANNNPVGAVAASFFFAALSNGCADMQRFTSIPSSVSEIVQGLIVLVISATIIIPKLRRIRKERKKELSPKEIGA